MISVFWGCPHSGKTTLAVESALALSASGKSVCLISAEDFAEIGLRFGRVVPSANSITLAVKDPKSLRSTVMKIDDNLMLLSPSATDSAIGLIFGKSQATGILKTADAIFDEVIIDATTWKSNAFTGEGIALAKNIFVPIPGQVITIPWMISNQDIFKKKADSVVFIRNESALKFDYEAMFRGLKGIVPAITVPYMPGITEMQNDGQPIWTNGSADKNSKAYRKAIRSIVCETYF